MTHTPSRRDRLPASDDSFLAALLQALLPAGYMAGVAGDCQGLCPTPKPDLQSRGKSPLEGRPRSGSDMLQPRRCAVTPTCSTLCEQAGGWQCPCCICLEGAQCGNIWQKTLMTTTEDQRVRRVFRDSRGDKCSMSLLAMASREGTSQGGLAQVVREEHILFSGPAPALLLLTVHGGICGSDSALWA